MSRGYTYTIASSVLTVHGEDPELLSLVHHYLKRFEAAADAVPTAQVSIYRNQQSLSIPEQSILYRVIDDTHYYKHDYAYTVTIPDTCIFLLNYEHGHLEAWLAQDYTHGIEMLIYMLKWMLIKTAEYDGALYLHGPFSEYKRQYFLVIGNSGSGKTTTHRHLLSLGATHYSDDVTLLHEEKAYAFLSDFAYSGRCDSNSPTTNAPPVEQDRIALLLPTIWNDTESALEETTFSEVRSELWEIYYQETSWNAFTMPKDAYLERASQYLQKARVYRIFSGSSSASVISTCASIMT